HDARYRCQADRGLTRPGSLCRRQRYRRDLLPVRARTLVHVKRVLLTGMSGTGKSSVVRELAARGFKAVDTDDGWSEPLPDGRQRWREDAIKALLATKDTDVLFVAGCEENQARFHAQFDHIILLSAPLEVVMGRLAGRTSNPYGKTPEELSRIVDDVAAVEPLLRRGGGHEGPAHHAA